MFKNLVYIILTIGIFSCLCPKIGAQNDTSFVENYESEFLGIAASLYVDSIVISAQRGGFKLEDFIEMVVTDTTFYQSFRELRKRSYHYDHHISFFDKKDKIKAEYQASKRQTITDNCREMSILSEQHSGNYYKRKKQRYYTARLFSQIFDTHGKVCNNIDGKSEKKEQSSIEYHIDLMKQVIFSPGIETDMPLVGKKMAIFSEDMQPYYEYSISSKTYKDSIDCYVFDVNAKEEYMNSKRGVIVRRLRTYFDKKSLRIISRDYRLSYKNLLYDFDIEISVRLQSLEDGEVYVPYYIKYDGYWDLALKSPEKAIFEVEFFNFN